MDDQLLAKARGAADQSAFLRAVASVREDGGARLALGDAPLRPLSPGEIARLESQGNTAEDWAKVRVADGFDPARVRGCDFLGEVVLGRFAGRAKVNGSQDLPAGLADSTLADCVVGHDVVVRGVRLLANYVVGPGAVIFDCGRVVCDKGTTFGNGGRVAVGVETGGRVVCVFAELGIELAAAAAQPTGPAFAAGYAAAVAEYESRAVCRRGILERSACVLGAGQVRNTYVGPFARIDGATLVEDSTLLSSDEQPARVESGACVRGSLLQWGSAVSTLAVVEGSLLTEHATVERHGKVTSSVLGPNAAVGGGEVTSCLLGPFVVCHHQSLLIATLWPGGKGNVAYGANVGSNHTSRAPDQEMVAGEGMFFGLGVNVKFPADFRASPYTVVACGASLLPQKLAFPFSLVAPPSASPEGVSPAFMEIFPGWMLRENLYALRRNEAKYRTRNKARRTRVAFEVLRPDTAALIRDARRRLEAVKEARDVYTEADIAGLGKNFLTEKSRRQAVETYRFFLHYFGLLRLLDQVRDAVAGGRFGDAPRLLDTPSQDPAWEGQRLVLVEECGAKDVLASLADLPRMAERLARDVEESKARDDRRGSRVIQDYADVHTPAGRDECVLRTWEETRALQAEVEGLLRRLYRHACGMHAPEDDPQSLPTLPAGAVSACLSVDAGN
jgi:hypothetical protein